MQSVSGNFNVLLKSFCEKRQYILCQKHVIVRRNVSDDGDTFKETKLLLYFRIENHGYATKTGITYANRPLSDVGPEGVK